KRIENFYDRLGQAAEHLRKTGADDALENAIMRWMLYGLPPANVHLGLSVGTNTMKEHVQFFRDVPAKVHFLSMEPLLENIVSFRNPNKKDWPNDATADDCYFDFQGVDGVIVGGESGESHENIRPMHRFWAERIQMAVQLYNARMMGVRPEVK